MTPEEEIQRAERARQLLDEPLIKEAFSFVRESLVGRIETAPITDHNLRSKLCDELAALYGVRLHLVSHMETGKMAERQLNMWDKAKNIVGIR